MDLENLDANQIKGLISLLQGLLPEDWRPDMSGVLVSVEGVANSQYLRVISIENKEINNDIKNWLSDWSKAMKTPIIYSNGTHWENL